MPLIRLTDIHIAFGTHVLFDKVNLTIRPGQRFGLLGRNGAGKSTFMKLLAEQIKPDSGEFWRRPQCRIAYLDQELPKADDMTLFDFVSLGLGETGKLLQQFHKLSQGDMTDDDLDKMAKVQQKIEAVDGWSFQQRIDTTLTQLELPPDTPLSALSGGWRRRAALAQALVSQPDILLLDEPTNHLDIPTIQWLEDLITSYQGALVVITHDRHFLQQIATHILELDRGELRNWDGDYHGFLQFREQQLAAEEKSNSEFDKKLAKEEVWIRQGIKARRTRNEGRVRALKKMRNERQARRELTGTATMQLEKAESSGKIVVEAENISKTYGDKTVVPKFSTRIMRGDRIGIVGANGAGKTTLLKLLLGELKPDTGTIKMGTKIEVAYFDQLRSILDPEKTVIDNIAEGREFITINGKNKHVISYLQDFLFEPSRCRQPVKALSGGEQNRLILAYLFSKPANVLVMDEPTNDLDVETLELLEDILLNFEGTLLLVSHDRHFIDNVVTSVMVFEGNGSLNEYVGDFSDWEAKGGQLLASKQAPPEHAEVTKPIESPQPAAQTASKAAPKKLSYKLQRELEQLPGEIETAETALKALEQKIANPDFYQQEKTEVSRVLAEMTKVQEHLNTLYQRWEAIENQ